MEHPQILIVDDDLQVRELLRDTFLGQGYKCQVAKNGMEALELFKASRPDLTVTDVKMPVMDGVAFLKAARAEDSTAAIIMLTAMEDVHTGVECMRQGAFDFLLKPVEMGQLLAIAAKALEQRALLIFDQQQQAEIERRAAEVARAAHYDSLTGLANRALFRDRLGRAQLRAARNEQHLGVMLLDIDRFKGINETLGHDAGDFLLTGVAERLRECVREVDSIARFGGDEFAIILEGLVQGESAAIVAERILASVARPFEVAGREVFVTTSAGIAIYPDDGADVSALVKNADSALFGAKAQGRNTYRFYTPDLNARALERLSLETGLRRALEREEFVLYYQPRVELASGRLLGAEALLRWIHPEHGLVPPGSFIPLAEESGLIIPIGEWVVRAACAQSRAWQEAGYRPLRIAVNISARQFAHRALRDTVASALQDSGLDAAHLEIELTEGLLMEHTDTVLATLGDLKAMGLLIAIDDFGTGYSSLSYLKRFPIDALKIDQSFVRDITTDANAAAISAAIVALARTLRLNVIAEGVETREQAELLLSQGCAEGQGYLYSRPLPADRFVEWLERGTA